MTLVDGPDSRNVGSIHTISANILAVFCGLAVTVLAKSEPISTSEDTGVSGYKGVEAIIRNRSKMRSVGTVEERTKRTYTELQQAARRTRYGELVSYYRLSSIA